MRLPSFTKSKDGKFRADIRVTYRYSKEDLTCILAQMALTYLEVYEYSPAEIWNCIKEGLKEYGTNVVSYSGDADDSDETYQWAKSQIAKL